MSRLKWTNCLLGRWYLYNKNDSTTELGFIEQVQVGRKLRYTFEGHEGMFFTNDCLREIADKIDELEDGI